MVDVNGEQLFDGFRVLGTPFVDGAMIAGKQNIWYGHAAKIVWFGVLWVFDIVAIREAFDLGAGFSAKDTWNKANNGVNHNEGR